MKAEDKIEIFEKKPISSAVIKLAVPTVISSLVTVIYSLVDTYFVGFMNDPIETAAVTLAAPVLLAFNAVNNLFGVGASSLISRSMGLKDYDKVKKASAFGFYCALIASILFSLACFFFRTGLLQLLGADSSTEGTTWGYMLWAVCLGAPPSILSVVMAYIIRSEGSSLHASIGTMSGCILNMVLDPVFILGFHMGAAGAGIATMISNYVACVYFLIFMFVRRKNTFLSIHPKDFQFTLPMVKDVCMVGIPAAIQNLLNVTGMTILNNFAAPYGADAVSAIGISHKIAMVPLNTALGFSTGVMPLIGYNYSNKNYRRMKESITYSFKLMLPIMVLISVLLFVFSTPVVHLFMEDESVVAYASTFLKEACIGLPLFLVDFMAVQVYQALGKGQYAFAFAITRKIILEIPAIILLNRIFPLYGIAFAQSFSEICLGCVGIVCLCRLFRKYKD
ncbi:MAG: MATE family efflux transporter [Lachnospiraceae bacterium]|nr:MATE family efflux transporter [Lachnospiraceae bacterium]